MPQDDKVQVNKKETDQLSMQSALAKSFSVRDKKQDKTMASLSSHMSFMAVTLTSIDKNISENTKMMSNMGKFLTEEKKSRKPVNLAQEARRHKQEKQQTDDLADIAKLMEENNRLTKKQKAGGKDWLSSLLGGLATAGLVAGGVGLLAWLFTGEGGALKKLVDGAKGIGGFFSWLIGGDKDSLKKMWGGLKGLTGGFFDFIFTGDSGDMKKSWENFKGTLPQKGILGWIISGDAANFANEAANFAKGTAGFAKGLLTGDFSDIKKGLGEMNDAAGWTGTAAIGGLAGFLITGNPIFLTAMIPLMTQMLHDWATKENPVEKAERLASQKEESEVLGFKVGAGPVEHTGKEYQLAKFLRSKLPGISFLGKVSEKMREADEGKEPMTFEAPTRKPSTGMTAKVQGWLRSILPGAEKKYQEILRADEEAQRLADRRAMLPTDTQTRFDQMLKEYERLTGEKIDKKKLLGPLGGLRTKKQQQMLREKYERGEGPPADKAGFSAHEYGLAFDVGSKMVAALKEKKLLSEYGFYNLPTPGEEHHIEDIFLKGRRGKILQQLGSGNMPSVTMAPKLGSADAEVTLSSESIGLIAKSIIEGNESMMRGAGTNNTAPVVITTDGRR